MDLAQIMKMTPEELEEWVRQNEARLGKMDHSSLYQLRDRLGRKSSMQDMVAPYEHRAFSRELTKENPLAGLAVGAITPLYQPYKALMGQSRSKPSLEQVFSGWYGVGEGLRSR